MADQFAEFLARLATDDDFRERYLADRDTVLDEAGLTAATRAALEGRDAAIVRDPLPSAMQSGFDPDSRNT